MTRQRILRSIALALALSLLAADALAEVYSFPYAGVRLEADSGWTVLTPETLSEQAADLARLSQDMEALRADYAASRTVFEVFLSGGARVSLSAVPAGPSLGSGEALMALYDRAPYKNAALDATNQYVSCEWSQEAGGLPASFAVLSTVRQGMLYRLTATGAGLAADALHGANQAVLERLSFLDQASLPNQSKPAPVLPLPIADDGITTPIALVNFTGLTAEDLTALTIRTLPGTALTLNTPSGDALIGHAKEDGLHTYNLSTRREAAYQYVLVAKAEGRTPSQMDISLERRLTGDALAAAYRKSALHVDAALYKKLADAPDAFAGQAVTFRGRVAAIEEREGFPCVLIYTSNPRTGVWQNPVWLLLTQAALMEEGAVYTAYGDVRGDTFPYAKTDEEPTEAPVILSQSVSK